MKKIGMFIAVLVLLALGWYFYNKNKKAAGLPDGASEKQAGASGSGGGGGGASAARSESSGGGGGIVTESQPRVINMGPAPAKSPVQTGGPRSGIMGIIKRPPVAVQQQAAAGNISLNPVSPTASKPPVQTGGPVQLRGPLTRFGSR